MSKRVLVTGANGGIGHALCQSLEANEFEVFGGIRSHDKAVSLSQPLVYGDITQPIAFHESLDVVVHSAGLAHQSHSESFHAVNLEGTKHVIRAARLAGIKRFVFLSSIKVLAGSSEPEALTDQSQPKPSDPYAKSKFEAEEYIKEYAKQYGLELVIIRLPLVVGLEKDVGNLKSLLGLIKKGIPLPLGGIHNQRSFIHIDNLCELVRLCITEPSAAGETFNVADATFSTPELIDLLARSYQLKSKLFPIPLVLLKGLLTMVGKRDSFEKLAGSLYIQADKASALLGWQPNLDVYVQQKPSNLA